MSLLTKYGTIYGQMPQVTGRVFFVAPSASYTIAGRTYSASDNNGGLAPTEAVLTIQRGIDLCTANVGDSVMLLNGTHTVTATINVNVAGITLWGVVSGEGNWNRNGDGLVAAGSRTVVTSTGTSDELFNVTVSNAEIGYMVVRPTTAWSAFSFQTASALDGLYFHDLVVDTRRPDPSTTTRGFDFTNRSGGNGTSRMGNAVGICTAYIERVTFLNRGAQGEAINLATCNVHIRDCRIDHISGTWASTLIVATGCGDSLVQNVVWTNSGTITLCAAGFAGNTTANSITFVDCKFGVAADIVGLTSVANAITCYEITSGGTLSVAN